MKDILLLLDAVEAPLRTTDTHGKPVYRIVFAATQPEERNSGVLMALARKLWQIVRPCVVFAATSSEYSRRAAIANGMTEIATIPYATWKTMDGRMPLASVAQPHTCSSLLMMEFPIDWSKWTSIVTGIAWKKIRKSISLVYSYRTTTTATTISPISTTTTMTSST
jgi:hypothetical protein